MKRSLLGETKENAASIGGGTPCGSGPGSMKLTAKLAPTWCDCDASVTVVQFPDTIRKAAWRPSSAHQSCGWPGA